MIAVLDLRINLLFSFGPGNLNEAGFALKVPSKLSVPSRSDGVNLARPFKAGSLTGLGFSSRSDD